MFSINQSRIRHTVVFTLKHPKGSQAEQDFLEAARKLSSIPGVEKFECLRQISSKNQYAFGLSMEFANQQVYEQYNTDAVHIAFVQHRWLKEVKDFMEIDYQVL